MDAGSLLALLSLFPGAAQASPSSDALVIRRVAVVEPEADRILEDRTVVVAGDRIVSVGPSADSSEGAEIPAGARVVDGEGRFLMAGLADMHVHLTDPRDGLLYVASGVTTIRNLSGQPYHLDLAEAYLRGRWIGPTLRSSGPQVRLAADATPVDAQAIVEEHQRQGYASVKLYGRTSRECYEALAEASRALGMPIVGHVPRNLTLEDVVEVGGHREISHAEEMLYAFFDRRSEPPAEVIEECAGLLAEAGVFVTPTIRVYAAIEPQVTDLESVLARPEMCAVPPLGRLMFGPGLNKYTAFDAGDVERIRRGTGTLLALTGFLDEVGVPLLLGTDAMNPSVVPGTSIVEELASLVEAGLSPARALATGTVAPAEFWGESAEFGRVRPGLRADLLLLDANPLTDVRHVARPAGVVLRGRFLAREELERLLDEQVAGYEAESAPVQRLTREDPSACLAAVDPDRPPPEAFFLSLASVYELIGNPDAVAQVVERALELYPDSLLLQAFVG